MLASKFSVTRSIFRQIYKQNFKFIPTQFIRAKRTCPDDGKGGCTALVRSGPPTLKSRCKQMAEDLHSCIKPSKKSRTCNVQESQKCDSSVSDMFVRQFTSVKQESEKIMHLIRTTAESLLSSFDNEINQKYECEIEKIQKEYNCAAAKKIEKLIALSPKCGTAKRIEASVMNDRTRMSIARWKVDSRVGIKCLQKDIKELEKVAEGKISMAMGIVGECRQAKSPQELADCVENKGCIADKILADTMDYTKLQLAFITDTKNQMMRENYKIADDITRRYFNCLHCFTENLHYQVKMCQEQEQRKK